MEYGLSSITCIPSLPFLSNLVLWKWLFSNHQILVLALPDCYSGGAFDFLFHHQDNPLIFPVYDLRFAVSMISFPSKSLKVQNHLDWKKCSQSLFKYSAVFIPFVLCLFFGFLRYLRAQTYSLIAFATIAYLRFSIPLSWIVLTSCLAFS